MSNEQEQYLEDLSPLLIQKIVFSPSQLQVLEQKYKRLSRENEYASESAEKVMLDKYREKGDAFVRRLEQYLETYKKENVENVELTDIMVNPEYETDNDSDQESHSDDEIQEMHSLRVLYPAMEKYLATQQEKMEKLKTEWFGMLKSLFEGDDESVKKDSERQPQKDFCQSKSVNMNITFTLFVVVMLALMILIFYEPYNTTNSTQVKRNDLISILEVISPLFKDYLKFHNITLPSNALYAYLGPCSFEATTAISVDATVANSIDASISTSVDAVISSSINVLEASSTDAAIVSSIGTTEGSFIGPLISSIETAVHSIDATAVSSTDSVVTMTVRNK